MTIPDDLRALAEFHEGHPTLPAPQVVYSALGTTATASGALVAFIDGTDDVTMDDSGYSFVMVRRRFGDLKVSMGVDRKLVEPAPVFATAAEIRERGAA